MRLALLANLLGAGCAEEPAETAALAQECTRNGVCDDGIFCNGAERCRDGHCEAGEPVDCDDGVSCSLDSCDEARWVCRHEAPDVDADGHPDAACTDSSARALGDDCDDADPLRFPGAVEVCDARGVDEDCNLSSVGDRDEDGDGAVAASCCNSSARQRQCGPDCDDHDPEVGPNATETCNGKDDDCDGLIDEAVELLLFRDQDEDGFGSGEVVLRSCVKVRGYAVIAGDCADLEPGIHPGAAESCELPAVDRDCNGEPNDLAGGCACENGAERACPLPGRCSEGVLRCAGEVWGACSIAPAPEECNELDDDCDGQVDEGVTADCYEDADGDGYAAAGAKPSTQCQNLQLGTACPAGFTKRAPALGAIDCAASDPSISPAAVELCNGKDDDCDGNVDQGLAVSQRFIDADGDGHAGTAVQRCSSDPTSAPEADDCMDDNALVHPNQDGVFSHPACGQGQAACLTDAGAWKCKVSNVDGCGPDLPSARWDYDCDDDVLGEPLVSAPCSDASSCGEGCGVSGFLIAASGAPGCGTTQPYQVCKCLGAQGGGCTGLMEQHPYPCH